jgi:serine/threonine-protein kinase
MRDGHVSQAAGGRPARTFERVDEACDHFEAAWRAGAAPRIEDYLAAAREDERPALLGEQVALERELRRRRGERPGVEEYLARFPGHAGVVRAAFGAPPEPGGGPAPRPSEDTGRNLLFGVMALQNNFIGRDDLLGAFAAWVADRARPLAHLLVDRGALDDARRGLLEALVAEHLKQHGGDPEASLAAVSSIGSVRDDLEWLGDPDLQASLAAAARSAGPRGAEATATYTPSSSRHAGERFRILHFHREGGLGRVYVARDEELGREVALKEIRPDKAAEAGLRGRFVLEAEINGGLEHPGIVPVYSLGTYDDGRPFYAMRFVEGDSLREAIESYHKEHPRPDPSAVEFRKLLGRFIDVCEAIAFAHSKGVLHRDLKPHNVMLGRYGETLLIDWGLAKATGRRTPAGADAAAEATLVPPSGSGHAATVGVLGTPAYMSPEQAAGAAGLLGPATDVYGLGAILFALFTGEPPVAGGPSEEVLDRVRRGAVRSPRSLNPSIPRALEAVCLRALAARPQDRYPTALALAEEVEHWLADEPVSALRESLGQQLARWMRRHRAAAQATVVALVVITAASVVFALLIDRARRSERDALDKAETALAAEREARQQAGVALAAETKANAQAKEQRARAEQRETLAIDAVTKFRDILVNSELTDRPELDSLRKALLEELLKFFRKLRDQLQSDDDTRPDALDGLASVTSDLAFTTSLTDLMSDSIRSYSESIAIWDRLARDYSAVAKYQDNLADSHYQIGGLLSMTHHPAEALESYRRAAAIWDRLARAYPAVTKFQDKLAGSLGDIGHLLHDMGRRDEALEADRRSMAIRERLAFTGPSNADHQSSLGVELWNMAVFEKGQGRWPETRDWLERAIEHQRKALALAPCDSYLEDLIRSLLLLAEVHRALNQPAEAVWAAREAADFLERLVRTDPSNDYHESTRGELMFDLAEFEKGQGRWREAREWLERARDWLERAIEHGKKALAAMPRSMKGDQGRVMVALLSLAKVHLALNQPGEAVRTARKCAELADKNPTSLYNAACSLALCVPLVQENRRHGLAAEAVQMLKKAIAAGWSDAQHTRRDPDLAPLRDRGDFRWLLAELFDRGFPADPFARQ